MENVFVGFRQNSVLYGCKEYLADKKQWTEIDEIIINFYKDNSGDNISDLFSKISWKAIGEFEKENNGYFLSMLLKEKSNEQYAIYHQWLDSKMNGKRNNKKPFYSPLFFEEIEGEMYAIFKNYATTFNKYNFDKTYIIDLDKDVLMIEDYKNGDKEEIGRNIHNK